MGDPYAVRFFGPLLTATMIIASSSTNAKPPEPADKSWTVFADSTDVYTSPTLESAVLGPIAKDQRVAGELLETDNRIEWLKFPFQQNDGFVPRAYLTRPHPVNVAEGDLQIGNEFVNRWWGIPISYEPSDLVKLDPRLTAGGREQSLRREAAESITRMLDDARAEGVDIRVTSSYRSGPMQVRIYLRAIRNDGLNQRYSAPPGHSEHQLGTTVDFVDPEEKHTFSRQFDKTPQGQWLEKNAGRYGWVRTYYPHNEAETGYISEPWHWRYFGVAKDQPAPTPTQAAWRDLNDL